MKGSVLWKVTGVCVSPGPAPVGRAARLPALCYRWETFSYGFLSGSESTGMRSPGGQPVLKLPQTALRPEWEPSGNTLARVGTCLPWRLQEQRAPLSLPPPGSV